MQKYLTYGEISAHYGVARETIRSWIKQGRIEIAFHTPGGRPRFRNPDYVEPAEPTTKGRTR